MGIGAIGGGLRRVGLCMPYSVTCGAEPGRPPLCAGLARELPRPPLRRPDEPAPGGRGMFSYAVGALAVGSGTQPLSSLLPIIAKNWLRAAIQSSFLAPWKRGQPSILQPVEVHILIVHQHGTEGPANARYPAQHTFHVAWKPPAVTKSGLLTMPERVGADGALALVAGLDAGGAVVGLRSADGLEAPLPEATAAPEKVTPGTVCGKPGGGELA